MKFKSIIVVLALLNLNFLVNAQNTSGELKRWHKVTLNFDGPDTSETATTNPFSDYALEVTFTHSSGLTYKIPGYYAACDDAADSSCSSGNQWVVHFSPGATGTWNWSASFKTGTDVAINGGGSSAGFMDGDTGSLSIAESDKSGRDHRSKEKGALQYVGEHYLRYSGTNPKNPNGKWFVKAGADSPENMMAYEDFDNTPNRGGRLKEWAAHQKDYDASDASAYTWDGDKGSELLGVVNYLHSQGANALSFLTFSLGGDDENVFPHLLKVSESVYNGYDEDKQWSSGVHQDRFDVSKLAQWENIFEYADKKGMYLHFKTMETENDNFMDGNTNGRVRKLYYRELVARFGHHLALNWNLTEETTIPDEVAIAITEYINSIDAYGHNIVIHTYPGDKIKKYTPLLGSKSKLTGASLQSDVDAIHGDVVSWLKKSKDAGRKWVVANDEQGSASVGVRIDDKEVRELVLYGTFLAGGAGVEYYYGYTNNDGDLKNQDHRLRGVKYKEASYALTFFGDYFNDYLIGAISDDGLTDASDDYVLANEGRAYAIYLPNGGTTNLSLPSGNAQYTLQWFNPRSGTLGATETLGTTLSAPDSDDDWLALIINDDGVAPPPVQNKAPEVSISTSITGTSVLEGTAIAVTADATDSDGTITQVAFFVDGKQIKIEKVIPYEAVLTDYAPGTYSITAVATDNDGAITTSELITIIITADDQEPLGECDEMIFEEKDGMVAVEAEHFLSQTKTEHREWFVIGDGANTPTPDPDAANDATASGKRYIEILPDTRVTHDDPLVSGVSFSNTSGAIAVIDYKVYINNPGKYYVWVRAHSVGTEDNGVHVGLDGSWPSTGNKMQWCSGKGQWTWESKQRTNEVHCGIAELIYLDIPTTGIHTISFSMREDGFEMDKFILSKTYTKPIGEGIAPVLYDCEQPPTPNEAPIVDISDPVSDISVKEGVDIDFTALASDTDGTISKVEFFVDGKILAVQNVAPYTATMSEYLEGSYSVTAVATDDDGATTTSSAVIITITEEDIDVPIPNKVPLVEISDPVSDISVKEGVDIDFTALASDTDGTISKVEFFVDGKSLAVQNVVPYTATMSEYPLGSYSVTAVATDDDGAKTTSAVVVVTISDDKINPGPTSGTLTLSPIHDAYLEGQKGYNDKIVRIENGKRVAYLMFDLSEAKAPITEAVLEFTVTDDVGSGEIIVHKGLSNTWTEQSLSSDNNPDIGVELGRVDGGHSLGEVRTIVLDPTEITGSEFSFVLSQSSGNDIAFASKEHGGVDAPKLTLKFGAATPIIKTVQLSPIHDAHVQSGIGYNQTIVRTEKGFRTGYLMFDLSEIEGDIISSTLQFTVTEDSGNGNLRIYQGTSNSWTETTISGANRPYQGALLGSSNQSFDMKSTPGIALDPTNIFGDRLSLIVELTDGNDFAFASKEHATENPPQLAITYNSTIFKKETKVDTGLVIFPNPTTDEVTIYSPVLDGRFIEVHSMTGVLLQTMRASRDTAIMDVSNLASGYYFVTVVNDVNFATSVFKLLIK